MNKCKGFPQFSIFGLRLRGNKQEKEEEVYFWKTFGGGRWRGKYFVSGREAEEEIFVYEEEKY